MRPDAPLVIDASVLINLLALKPAHLACIANAVGRPMLVAPHVRSETVRDPRTGTTAEPRLGELFAKETLAIAELNAEEIELFVDLVAAEPPNDLDDGEAATIAIAARRSIVAIVDEAKGSRIAAERSVSCMSTVELLLSPRSRHALGSAAGEAVEAALSLARMRVPASLRSVVIDLIGRDAAMQFSQLRKARPPRS